MHKFLLFLGGFFAVIFAFLSVTTSLFVVIFYGPSRLLFDSNLYKRTLSDEGIYQKIPAFASHFLPSNITIPPCADSQEACENIPIGNVPPTISINLAPENWQALLEIFLPPDETQTLVETALDRFFLLIHGNVNQVSISIDTIKGDLTGNVEEGGLHRFLDSLPLCSEAEIAQLSTPNPTEITVPLCKPSDEILNLLNPIFLAQANSYINRIPDSVKISLPASTLANIRLSLSFLAWIPLLPLPFLLGAIWLGARSLKGRFRLTGILLFISGLLSLGVGLVFRFGSKAILDLVLGLQNKAIWTPDLVSFLHQLGGFLVYQLTDRIIYPALILLLIGLMAWIGSALIHKKVIGPLIHSSAASVEES